MKIHIPAFEAMERCNEHLNHGPIDIDLGEDVVKVTRCKDCKHWDGSVCEVHSEWPDKYNTGHMDYTEADDFCSYGELKEGAE